MEPCCELIVVCDSSICQGYNSQHLEKKVYQHGGKPEAKHLDEPRYSLSRWDRVQLSRHRDRPYTADYIKLMCRDFFELRGDRRYADDHAILGGLVTFAGRTVMLIGHQKGRDTRQKQICTLCASEVAYRARLARCNGGLPRARFTIMPTL